ncbi:MAG: helix-turn-helix domain-containing protein [Phycisphaerales bacterium]|jgi:transcriptional regulator with XRE-family HTH domain
MSRTVNKPPIHSTRHATSVSELRPFAELVAAMAPASRKRVDERFNDTMARLRLGDIREAVGKTQVELAAELGLGQGSVSKIESAADMYLSTLRRYVEALGGELEVLARFPEGTVVPIASLATPKRAVRKRVVESRTSGAKKKPAARKSAPTRSGKQASRKR